MGSQYWELEAHFLFTVNHMLATVTLKKRNYSKPLNPGILFIKHIEVYTLQLNSMAVLLHCDWWILPPMVLIVKTHSTKLVEC